MRPFAVQSGHRLDQVLHDFGLADEGDGSFFPKGLNDLFAVSGHEDKRDHFSPGVQLLPCRQSIKARHRDVADDHVRLQADCRFDELLAVGDSSDHLVMAGEERDHAGPHVVVVVCNQHSWHADVGAHEWLTTYVKRARVSLLAGKESGGGFTT